MSQNRPKCPRCNGNRIISSGRCWKCKDCGRQWLKNLVNPKPKTQKKAYVMQNPTKVFCCVCSSETTIDNPYSEVGRFYCRECLKKHGGEEVRLKMRDSNYSPVIGVPKIGGI